MSKRALGNVKITRHEHSQYLLLYNYFITDEQLSSGLRRFLERQKWYISVITWALVFARYIHIHTHTHTHTHIYIAILCIYLCPWACSFLAWAYISGKSLVPMQLLLHNVLSMKREQSNDQRIKETLNAQWMNYINI